MKHLLLRTRLMFVALTFLFAINQSAIAQNTSFQTAKSTLVNIEQTGSICENTSAFYKTVLPSDGHYRVYVEATNKGNGTGNFYLKVYDEKQGNGNIANQTVANYTGQGSVSADSLDLFCRSANDTIYFVASQESQCYDYKLRYVLVGITTPNDVSDNNTFGTASLFVINDTASGHIGYVKGNGNNDDVDFLKAAIPTDGRYRVYVEATNTGSSAGLFYFNGYDKRKENGNLFNLTPAYYSSPGTTSKDSVDLYCIAANDTLYFKTSQTFNCFTYKVSFRQIGAPSDNDTEPNDSFSQATYFNIKDTAKGHIGYTNGGVVNDPLDYYKIILPTDGKYRIFMQATNTGNGSGILTVSGFDQRKENGNIFNATIAYYSGPATTTTDSVDLFCRSANDTLYFRVNQTFQCFNYKIWYQLIGTPSDNDVEPNGSFEEARPFKINEVVKGHIGYVAGNAVTDQYDYYKAVLPADGSYRITMQATNTGNSSGILYVSGFDQRKDNGNLFNSTPAYYSGPDATTTDSADIYCRSAGDTLYFRVSQVFQCFNYSLSFKLIGSPSDNDSEPNNTFSAATGFGQGDTAKGHIGYVADGGVTDPIDYFKTVLPADGVVRVYMEATNTGNGTGLLYVTGYDQRKENGNIFTSAPAYYSNANTTTKDSVDLYCRSGGDTLYFAVTQAYQCFNYKISYKILPQQIVSNGKDVEPNGTIEQAATLNYRDSALGHVGYLLGGQFDDVDYYKITPPTKGTLLISLQTVNTGTGQGLFYITGYNKNKQEVFSRNVVYYAGAGNVSNDILPVECQGTDVFYISVRTASSCFAYNLKYTVTLGEDTTVYTCSACTTDISRLYDVTPFTEVKYTNVATPEAAVNATSVTGGVYMLTVINGTNECTRDTAIITVSSGQKLYFDSIPGKTFGDAPFTINATSTAGLPVTYKVISGPATVSGNTVTITGAGVVTIRAEQAGNSAYNYAMAERTFTVAKAAATITFSNLVKVYDGQAFVPVVTTNPASLQVDFSYGTLSSAPVNAGRYLITASINNSNYTGQNSDSILIQKANQSITLTPVPDKEFGAAPFNVGATSTSGLPVTFTYTSNPVNIITLAGNTVTLKGLGTVIVTASQPGNGNYNAGQNVSDTFEISKGHQQISFPAIADQYVGDTLILKATASSTLPVTYSISTIPAGVVATLKNDTLFFNGTTGSVTVTAKQAGNDTYFAVEAQQTFKVSGTQQTITFTAIANKVLGDAPFALQASASSGLPVTFTIISGAASISNNTITILGSGLITIEANQPGSPRYGAAQPVRQSFTVLKKYPDLFVQNVTSGNTTLKKGDEVTVAWKVSNMGVIASAANWTERIYIQSATGDNRTFIKQVFYSNTDSLLVNGSINRSDKVLIPSQVTVGDAGVFVVEVVPGANVEEANGSQANNIGVQAASWAVNKQLQLDLSANQITEGSLESIQATITRSGSNQSPLVVTLSAASPSRFNMPASVTIPTGQSTFSFNITATNNNAIEGNITDTLRITAPNYEADKAAITIGDNDRPTLMVTLPNEAMEGQTLTVTISTDLVLLQPLQVYLTSQNPVHFPVPASVTIPAGSQSVQVQVPLAADQVPEINEAVKVTAGAANHTSGNATIFVKDDDIPAIELVLQTNIVSEAAGLFATKATLRRKDVSNTSAFKVNLSSDRANTLILPSAISLGTGENEKTFDVGVTDNSLNDGQRTVNVLASLYINSCGCNTPLNSIGTARAPLTITDNDGPALTITASELTLAEGLPNAGSLRITRNSSVSNPLTVNLTSSNTNEATVPASATIPAGQSFVDVSIATINDNVADGNQQVYFNATAAGFATGSVWVVVSDQNKPDFTIPVVKLSSNTARAMSIFDYTVTIKNNGFSTAPSGVKVYGYLSADNVIDANDTLIISQVLAEAIAPGQTKQLVNAIATPNMPGQYKLLFKVNPDAALSELLATNNTSTPIDFTIDPDYTVNAIVDALYYLRGTAIPVRGTALRSDGKPASNEEVEVYTIINGLRRTMNATTNASGNYTTQFIPLANESGHYIVGAAFPGLGSTNEQDNFDILGVRVNNGQVPQFKVLLNQVVTGTLTVQNMSDRVLKDFTLSPVTLPNRASIRFDTIATIAGNATVALGYTIKGTALSQGNNFEVASLKAIAADGAIQPVTLYYFCQAPNGYIEANINSIDVTASQSTGERLVELRVVNKGIGSSGDLNISLPQIGWLTSVTPVTLPPIVNGDTAIIVIRFEASQEIPFNYPVAGNIGINAQNGNSLSIPFTFTKVSSSTGQAKITVTNQFTYFTDAAPKVKDAHVIIKNYYTGEVYADGMTDANGVLLADSIPEGINRIIVEKAQHQPFNGTLTINPGSTLDKTIFLNYQAITFNWSVVPTAIEDEYDITLETKFETNIPIPVVTIDMPKEMPALTGSETYAFNVTLTNHGLIKADEVQLGLPTSDPEYEFVTNYVPAELLAQQSIQIPVIMRRRTTPPVSGGRATITNISRFLGIQPIKYKGMEGGDCKGFTSVTYSYTCNIKTGLWEKGGAIFSYSGRRCTDPNSSYNGVPIDVGNVPTNDAGGGYNDVPCATCGPGGLTGQATKPTEPEETKNKSCVQCINDIIGVVQGCGGPGGAGVGAASCVLGNFLDNKGAEEYLTCIPGAIPSPIGCAKGISDALSDCGATQSSGRAGYAGRATGGLGDAFTAINQNFKDAISVYQVREEWGKEYFGDMIFSDAWDRLSGLIQPYVSGVDSIPPAAQTSILAAMQGYEIQPATINAFFVRWNTSVYARSQGIKEPNASYPNIINWNKVRSYSDAMIDATNKAISKGYTSVYDMYTKEYAALNVLLDRQSNAVCASVTVQLSQRLTMTREAFEGTLEIFNGHPTNKMDSMTVSIKITDQNGVPANDLFEIQTKSLTNIGNITGTGNIPAQQKGLIKFIFIPEINAAPISPVVYNFSGSVRYFDPYVQAMVTMPLSEIPLTVNPSPNLMLHYFMQRNILGDDALTTLDIEPSIPAELAVMVENQGYGAAVNMMISSAQPKITDNEKGLAVNFNLVGSNFQGQPKKLGVTDINFGTIPALQTRIGQWYFTSSLLGKFVSYDAKVVHNNSFNNPELSLVKGVKLHELSKSIKLYGAPEDGIIDFLVNDIFDVNDVPDVIYDSRGNRTSKVSMAAAGSFNSPVLPPTFTNTLSVTASQVGWNYIKLNDPGNKHYELVSVTRADGQVIPLDNAWLTYVTLPLSQKPVYENKFHFVDTFPTLQPVTYTVVWKPGNVNVPRVDTISGAPKEVTPIQVQELQVRFNKAIDPATFTYQDLTLTVQGGQNIMNSSVIITQVDTATFNINFGSLTTANGFFAFTVQAANVADIYGINGQAGKQVTWTQMLNVPVVQSFLGIPENRVAASYKTIQVLFNLPMDVATVTATRFKIYKDNIVQQGSLVIDSISANHKLFYLSGLEQLLTQNGVYELAVDLPNMKSESQASGIQVQSILLTVDNAGPLVVKLEKVNTGGLDLQHNPFVSIQFNEEVAGFNTSSLHLTRNGDVIPIIYNQLSNTDLKTWLAGNFGMATYPDGNYEFTIDMSGVKDKLGNFGSGTQKINWKVDRTTTLQITNLNITPDRGYLASDGITSEQSLTVAFTLSDAASQVAIYQKDLGGEKILATLNNVAAGIVTTPISVATAGNMSIKISAVGLNGGSGNAEKILFIDAIPLSAKWMFTNNRQLPRQVDTIPVVFSNKLLNNNGLLTATSFTHNSASLSKAGISYRSINDTLYEVSGLRSASTAAGNYELKLQLPAFSKYLSGKNGEGEVVVKWTVLSTNRPPVANAGLDTLISKVDTVRLSGLQSYDPDADQVTYKWIAPDGIVLKDSTSATPAFAVTAADQGKTFTFLLIVNDGTLFTTDAIKVTVDFRAGDILPVTWLTFTGKQVGADALITWATASEFNTRSFVIERSLDGRNFLDIGSVSAAGASVSTNNYNYTDRNAMNLAGKTVYYRLRQVDKDGSFTYSSIVSLPIKPGKALEVMVKAYPNPFVQTITLQVVNVTTTSEHDQVALYTINGKLLYRRKLAGMGSSTILLKDLPNLKPGMYVLQTSIDGKHYTFKMERQ